jgi:ABC-2 type transport system ATP-binding protein
VLELDEVSRRFDATLALDRLSFGVPPGVIWGFVGRNGAGKTTAMRIILGLLAADSGEVRWHGRPIDAEVRRRAGYMPEERGLYPKMRVADQLRYLAELRGLTAGDAQAATTALIERLGISERADDRVQALSLGNQQRVQLAAALVHDPALLILDEPFSGLDPVAVDVLSQTLSERVANGATVLFSSHQLELVERFSAGVTIIDRGRLVATGTIAALRRQNATAQIRVAVDTDWWRDTSSARIIGRNGRQLTIEIADGADDQEVLDAARAAGPVAVFARVEPSLADIFREAITVETREAAA